MRSSQFWSLFLLLLTGHLVNAWKDVHRPMAKKEKTTSEEQKPWLRTVYSTKAELVTPTVIAGVTFSAKPLATPDPLEPWVSLNKDGSPKTIKPEIKNGRTKKARPDYSTYFQTIATKTYSYEDLKAHNMDTDDTYEEEIYIDEDDTYVSLNPIIRCTPERYFNKGRAKDVSSAPFCTPRENSMLKVDKTYFITWYTRYFVNEHSEEIADKVRIHVSYVKEKANEKGFHKRDEIPVKEENIAAKGDTVVKDEEDIVDSATTINSNVPATFFISEWIKNDAGVYPLTVDAEWLQGYYERKVVISVQPSYVPDDEFDPLEYGVMSYILLGSKVTKPNREDDGGFADYEWYYVALAIPTVVVISFILMYFFLSLNKGNRSFNNVTDSALSKKHRVIGTISKMKKFKNMKNRRYDELPTFQKKSSKQF